MLLVFFLFASCATSPRTGPALADGAPDFSVLPPGADIYLYAGIADAKDLLEAVSFEGVSSGDASRILDMTDTALAAFYPESAPRRFFLAGRGSYPNLRAGLSMSFSRDWKKKKSETGNRYWYSAANKLGVALGAKLAFVSDGDPFAPGSGASPAPGGFEEFLSTCVLSGWLNNPGEKVNGFLEKLGLPIQIPAEDFLFGAARIPAAAESADLAPYELLFRIRTPSASNARSLLSLISMARLFIPAAAARPVTGPGAGPTEGQVPDGAAMTPQDALALLFTNAPESDGAYITLRTPPVSAERIALLFKMFSVYSN